MATRANIKIIGDSEIFLYKHFDGNPNYLGEDLKRIMSNILIFSPSNYNGLAKVIMQHCRGNIEYCDKEHGDISYLYVIDLNIKDMYVYKVNYKYDNDNPLKYKKSYRLINI